MGWGVKMICRVHYEINNILSYSKKCVNMLLGFKSYIQCEVYGRLGYPCCLSSIRMPLWHEKHHHVSWYQCIYQR